VAAVYHSKEILVKDRHINMTDCLIIGGGISGMLTALELHKAGIKVTVIDKRCVGKESSWAGGGIISPLYPWRFSHAVNVLARWSQKHYPKFIKNLRQYSHIDPEYVRNGLLVLDTENALQACEWAEKYQVYMENLDGGSTCIHEPELKLHTNAFWLPEVGQVRNPRLLQALKETLIALSIPILEHVPVNDLHVENNKITGVNTTQGFIYADTVIVTAGAWTAELFKSIDTTINIKPVRGQMILFKAQPGLVSRIILANEHYVIPRRDGHILVGSTVEHVGFDKQVTKTALEDLKYFAFDLIPRLTDYTVKRHWAGLRPGTSQGIPYIGQHPNIEGLYFNAGHFRNGIVLGLASARLLADIMLARPPIIDPQLYALEAVH